MNKARRAQLANVAEEACGLSFRLEELKDEEQEYFDNMPESIQGSEKGELAESAINAMQSAIDTIEDAVGLIEEAQG